MPPQGYSRRKLLACTALSALSAGCSGYVDNGPDCAQRGFPIEDRSEAIDGWTTSVTSSNPDIDGSCSRSTSVVCFEVTVRLNDPEAVDQLFARNSDGELVVDRSIGDEQEQITAEVAVFDYGERETFHIEVLEDGTVVEEARITIDCPTRENSTVPDFNDTDG